MIKTPPYELATPRLYLRAGEIMDSEFLFKNYTGSEEASLYLQRKPHRSVADTQAMLKVWGRESWDANNHFAWVISEKKNNEAIGIILFIINGSFGEIHFGLTPSLSGQGLTTEALQAIMAWVATSSDINEVSTVCDCEHVASARVLSKSGFIRQNFLPNHLLLPNFGNNRNCWHFSWKKR